MSTLRIFAVLLCAVFATAATTNYASAQLSDKAKRDLKSIDETPKLTNEPDMQYRTRSSVPSPASGDDALRARKEESLRRFEEQQRLDIDRDLRDQLRQK
jgi:hypothetical protein